MVSYETAKESILGTSCSNNDGNVVIISPKPIVQPNTLNHL